MLRWLGWQLAKWRLASLAGKHPPRHVRVSRQFHRARAKDLPPDAEGYVWMGRAWNEFAAWFIPEYDWFLASAEGYFGQPIQAVLDLACGTGLLSRRLARRARVVVGLDASSAMLQVACRRTRAGNVRYLEADFRAFCLNETFDAAVCASDSLNYVAAPEELADVFRCVGQHLRPGGLFTFDVLDGKAFRAMAGTKVTASVDDTGFEVYHLFDPVSRVGEDRAVCDGGIERHRRVPLEVRDVHRAAGATGMAVIEHFGTTRWRAYRRQFYMLRKP
jgi:SAM-dependent methyltransferase